MSLIEKITQFIKDDLSLPDIGWANRQYEFYLIFGPNDPSKFPWVKSSWEVYFEPYFDQLVKQVGVPKDTGVRVLKYQPEKRLSKKDNKEFVYHSEVKFGRLKWDLKSHEKWTSQNNADRYFQHFELWAPIWTVCQRRSSPPDIYISICNERSIGNENVLQFEYLVVVAVAKSLKIDSRPILANLSESINAKATVLKTRRWGKPENSGSWTFRNGIQDTFSNGIYKGRNPHSIDFEQLEFEPTWDVIYRQK